MISIKFRSNFVEIILRQWCSPVNLLYIFQTSFPKNAFGGLLLFHAFTAIHIHSKWVGRSNELPKKCQIWSFFWFMLFNFHTECVEPKNRSLDAFYAVMPFIKDVNKSHLISLHKNCSSSELFWSLFSPNAWKTDQNNIKYGLFSRSIWRYIRFQILFFTLKCLKHILNPPCHWFSFPSRQKDILKMSYEDTQNISARCLLDVRFANLKDILHGCPKDISYSGKRDISQRQFLDILAR